VFFRGAADGSFFVIADEPARNVHIAFSGEDDDVRPFHSDAAASEPEEPRAGERPRHDPGYYAAFVPDPDR